jgi:ketosteroid isomerase-like protein
MSEPGLHGTSNRASDRCAAVASSGDVVADGGSCRDQCEQRGHSGDQAGGGDEGAGLLASHAVGRTECGRAEFRAAQGRGGGVGEVGANVDAVMMRDYDRLASLFTGDGAVPMPHVNAAAVGRGQIRAGVERLQGPWDYFVQTTHPGTIRLDGDTASGRAYISELMHGHDGASELNYAVYHDRYRRTPDGWKFTERVYEVRYLDRSPLAGSAPPAARSAPPRT